MFPEIEIALTLPGHVAGVVDLQALCFPPPFPAELLWTNEQVNRHLELFPSGQFVALDQGKVIGSATSCVISEDAWQNHSNWDGAVGDHFLSQHTPGGTTLFAVDISVHPDFRGQGIGRKLYEARFQLARTLDLRRVATVCRIPGYHVQKRIHGPTAEEYCEGVKQGKWNDPTLSVLLKYGLEFQRVMADYMHDEESGNYGARLEWIPEVSSTTSQK